MQEWKDWEQVDTGKNASKPPTFNDWGTDSEPSLDNDDDDNNRKKRNADATDDYSSDFEFRSGFLSKITELSRVERMELGHNLTTMLTSCSFAGKKCTPK